MTKIFCECCDVCELNREDLPFKVTFQGIEIFEEDWVINPTTMCASYTVLYAPGAWTEVKSAVAKTVVNNYSYTESHVACNRPLIAGCVGTGTFSLVKTRTLRHYENYSRSDALYLIYRLSSITISLYKAKVKDCTDAPTSGCLWFASLQINYQYKSVNSNTFTREYGCEVLAESFCCPATGSSSSYTQDDATVFNYLKSGYPGGLSSFSIVRTHRITEGVSETLTFAENDCIPDCVVDGFAPRCHNWSVCDQEPIVFQTTDIVTSQCFLKTLTVNSTSISSTIRYISSDTVGAFANSNCGSLTHFAAVNCIAGMVVSLPNHTLTPVYEDELGNPCPGLNPIIGMCTLDPAPITVPLCDEPTDPFANECYVRVVAQGSTLNPANMYLATEKLCCGTSYADVAITNTNSGYTMQSITVTIPSFNLSILW